MRRPFEKTRVWRRRAAENRPGRRRVRTYKFKSRDRDERRDDDDDDDDDRFTPETSC